MSTTFRLLVQTLVCAAVAVAAVRPAAGIYIDPDVTIPFTDHPAVGKVGHTGAAGTFVGTGFLIENNLLPQRSFVLTAQHNIPGVADANGRFEYFNDPANPAVGTMIASNRVRRFPGFDGVDVSRDIGLFRFNVPVAGVAPLPLSNVAPAAGNNQHFVGYGVGNGTPYGHKRETNFTVNATNRDWVNWLTPAGGPHTTSGDSGGPHRIAAAVVGVHESGPAVLGAAGTGRAARVDTEFHRNWIDSYAQRTIFWDRLRLDGATVDGFQRPADEYGLNGLSAPWLVVGGIPHPVFGVIPFNDEGWHSFSSIGRDAASAAELYLDDTMGQGRTMRTGGRSVIARTVEVPGGMAEITLDVGRRWNSLELQDDFGVTNPDTGEIIWAGALESALGTLDNWVTRTVTISSTTVEDNAFVHVMLVVVPEPATGAVLLVMVLVLILSFARSGKRQAFAG